MEESQRVRKGKARESFHLSDGADDERSWRLERTKSGRAGDGNGAGKNRPKKHGTVSFVDKFALGGPNKRREKVPGGGTGRLQLCPGSACQGLLEKGGSVSRKKAQGSLAKLSDEMDGAKALTFAVPVSQASIGSSSSRMGERGKGQVKEISSHGGSTLM